MSKLACAQDRIELLNRIGAPTVEHLAFDTRRGVANAEPDEKAIELGLGQRVGPVELLGVLRCDDEERVFELVGFTVDRNLTFIHGFEERALGLRRRAVDLVGKKDLGEDRTWSELERPLRLIEHVAAEDIRRHQVGGAL